ncbi:tRNA lysidine(34) synthetase TilS [Paenalkalicoccus suaedae]|uniref:tRNA(Ile)-lysidine synthase n=1 Tax=Paenalkalicoccus suaedae TaxID=2592382 RepID=A0A859FBP9_9BACI|nr:tRNA lysidine(34) synthetase TilS [Paenalkalicoccus suaedae]QKS69656.1 tRNA lysidine(34) synthetase TilS [Paenalkalicoccus suaedae]
MKQVIDEFVTRLQLIDADASIVVAVSGGADSMALLHYFAQTHRDVYAIHLNHQLRGKESDQDEALVKRYCAELDVTCKTVRINVKAQMSQNRHSLQQSARELRYEQIRTYMHEVGAIYATTAHHGDDQVETMLMRQIRGAVSGRGGIKAIRAFHEGYLIRPFLCVAKREIEAYCRQHAVPYRNDSSNAKPDYMRNRLRADVLPLLKQENPRIHETMQWQAERIQEDEAYLHEVAKEHAERIMTIDQQDLIVVPIKEFETVPHALQSRVVHLLLKYLSPLAEGDFTRRHIQDLQMMLHSQKASFELHFPHELVCQKVYELVYIKRTQVETSYVPSIWREPLLDNLEMDLPLGTLYVSYDAPSPSFPKEAEVIALKAQDAPFYVRNRRAGDVMTYKGGTGTKKVKKIFIDAKVPREHRDVWPLIEDSFGKILWIPFLQVASGIEVLEDDAHRVFVAYKQHK